VFATCTHLQACTAKASLLWQAYQPSTDDRSFLFMLTVKVKGGINSNSTAASSPKAHTSPRLPKDS
jgi:hypothetical protein